MIKFVTKESFGYFIDLLEKKVKTGEYDIHDVFKALRDLKDRLFYSVKEWRENERENRYD